MVSLRLARSILLGLVACAILVSPAAADIEQAFRGAKRSIERQLADKQPETRVAGIRELEQYPLVDAARLLVQVLFKGQPPEVRRAAYEALVKLSDNKDIAVYLNTIVRRAACGKMLSDETVPIVSALLASQRPGADQASLELIEKSAASVKHGLVSLLALVDEMSDRGDQPDLRSLRKFTKTKIFAADFAFRRAVVEAIVGIHTPEAVEVLIGLLPNLKGQVQADVVVDVLQKATGQTFAADNARWAGWWQNNKAKFHYPPLPAASGYLYGKRVVFMFDVSWAMDGAEGGFPWLNPPPAAMRPLGTKMAAAKRELIYAITRLDEDTKFSIISFNSAHWGSVSLWQKQLQAATPQMKYNASVFVESERVRHQTDRASFAALEAAFALDPESIFFVTDGEPNGDPNKCNNAAEVLTVVSMANRPRRVPFHTLGIGAGAPGGPSDVFLRSLAAQNFGTYRRVDE